VALKTQILVGGRGLAGGIKFADNPKEAEEAATGILGETLKDQEVRCVLVEEKVPIEKEYYLGVTIDYEGKCPIIIASSRGGVDIETIAAEHSEDIVKERIDSPLGLTNFQARLIAKKAGLSGREMLTFASTMASLHKILYAYDADLVEINPLAYTADKQFIAVDAKINLDDNASFRHSELYSEFQTDRQIPTKGTRLRKALAEKAKIPTYIELNGDLGIIADGAGTGMLTFDLTKDYGGRICTYCELGGRATPALIEEAMRIVLSNDKIKVLLINLIGGLNRMDEMAQGITSYVSKEGGGRETAKIIVRMSGTLEKEGRIILEASRITSFDNIYDAIEEALQLTGGN
jgi:succinyl-CoA synthetase beta subunit